jgi:catechol 2,3-dioxygenase-like lactoylglutathione lyase family enzyme
MRQYIARIMLLVDDYDRAIQFYTNALGFQLVEDTVLSETKRWVVVAPQGVSECALLLAKAATDEQRHTIGKQGGGRVFLFLYTDDWQREYNHYQAHNVRIVREPQHEAYGTVFVIADLYGNLWDVIQT